MEELNGVVVLEEAAWSGPQRLKQEPSETTLAICQQRKECDGSDGWESSPRCGCGKWDDDDVQRQQIGNEMKRVLGFRELDEFEQGKQGTEEEEQKQRNRTIRRRRFR